MIAKWIADVVQAQHSKVRSCFSVLNSLCIFWFSHFHSIIENVGRQGQFPHGIDILTKCDYYAVSQLQNCYLHLSKFIAEFDEYRQPVIDHLLEYKFNHWDQAVRELTSKALFNLTDCCPEYMASVVVPQLLKHSFSIDLNTRHGALLSLGEIIHGKKTEATYAHTNGKRKEITFIIFIIFLFWLET